jgi:tRNA A58 N-methylase Trm61
MPVKARTQRGPFAAGDQVQLTDPKGRMHQIVLSSGGTFHTHRGALAHDDLIGQPEGSVVTASSGTAYVALRPLLADYTLAMKRGATIVYPKDAAQILAYADVFPGARVLEAGAGSGALSCWLLRAIGPDGELVSFEARPDFAEIARENVRKYFGEVPAWWRLVAGELSAEVALDPSITAGAFARRRQESQDPGQTAVRGGAPSPGDNTAAQQRQPPDAYPAPQAPSRGLAPGEGDIEDSGGAPYVLGEGLPPAQGRAGGDRSPRGEHSTFDRVILDLLAPWENVAGAARALIPGGLICCYVATTTQLSRVVEELRAHGAFFEPAAWETLNRGWHVDGLAVRPDHRMIAHTGFLVTARRLADGVTAPSRRRRPAKGAHVPADPMAVPADPMAKTAIVSGPQERHVSRGGDPPYPPSVASGDTVDPDSGDAQGGAAVRPGAETAAPQAPAVTLPESDEALLESDELLLDDIHPAAE